MRTEMVRVCRQLQQVVILGAATLTMAQSATAGILSLHSGNHRAFAESIPNLDASLSYAVFERSNASGDVFGTGMSNFDSTFNSAIGFPAQLDTSAQYLYVYQYVNDGPGTAAFNRLLIPATGITSLGHWIWGLQDGHGPVDSGNPFGANGASFQAAAPPSLGVQSGVVANTLSVVDKEPALYYTNDMVTANFGLHAGETTTLFGFTSNLPPVIRYVSREQCHDRFACGGFVTPLSTDFNGDGNIDNFDLEHWENYYGSDFSDADGDGDTDGTDYLNWQQQRSPVFSLVSAASAVPEPSTTLLALIALITTATGWANGRVGCHVSL